MLQVNRALWCIIFVEKSAIFWAQIPTERMARQAARTIGRPGVTCHQGGDDRAIRHG
jgi:hypothetical protein